MNRSSTQLQAFIGRMNAGDAAAKNQLFTHAYERLRLLTRKMFTDFGRVKQLEDTDDVLQNAAIRLNRAMDALTVATVAEFFRLAATAIRRELLDLARYHSRQLQAQVQGAPGARTSVGQAGGPDPSDSTYEPSRLEAWAEFHQQVEGLPDDEREVFDLIWYQGITQSEAASMLGISRQAVQRLWLKARLRLKAVLDRNQWGFLTSRKA